jgi:hypothetical protein
MTQIAVQQFWLGRPLAGLMWIGAAARGHLAASIEVAA